MFWFWTGVIQHFYSNTETPHGLVCQFSGLFVSQQKDNLPVSFQKLLMRNWVDMTKCLLMCKRYASSLVWWHVVSEGMRLLLSLPEQHAPLLGSLLFQDFQRMLSQRSNVLSFADFCMTASLHNLLYRSNFSGTKWSFQVLKRKFNCKNE